MSAAHDEAPADPPAGLPTPSRRTALTAAGLAAGAGALAACSSPGEGETGRQPSSAPTSAAPSPREPDPKAPNILMVMLDDLGWGEVGAYGQQQIVTPHIDALAQSGVRFTAGYAAPLCGPSRCSLFTGRHTGNSAVRTNGEAKIGFPDDECFAEILQRAGYRTCLVGKWGFGGLVKGPSHPLNKGFDEFCGFLTHSEAHDYYPYNYQLDRRTVKNEGRRYGNAVFVEHAGRFLDSVRPDERFFLGVMLTTPHAPNVAPPRVTRYERLGWPDHEAHHAAQITWSDYQVGFLMQKLREKGLLDNTLVIFTSDNGPHAEGVDPRFFHAAGPFRGIKRDVYEGGIRVPLIMRIPDSLRTGRSPRPGTSVRTPVANWDFLTSFSELAGQGRVRGDGRSFVPLLQGRRPEQRRYLYWEYGLDDRPLRKAVRFNQYKAVRRRGHPIEIYDLSRDIGERHDLARTRPAQVARASRLFREIAAERGAMV